MKSTKHTKRKFIANFSCVSCFSWFNPFPLIQPILRRQTLRHINLGDVADVFGDERFDFELEVVFEHLLNLSLPVLFLLEPGILGDLFGAFFVVFVQRDFDAVGEAAAVVVDAAQAEVLGVGDGHSLGLEGEVDRTLLQHAVDIVAPGIVIEHAVDGQFKLVVQTIKHSSHAARRLARAVGEDAVVLFPKAIFIKALPDGAFFDVEDKCGVAFFAVEFDHLGFDDRRNGIAARAHTGAVDGVAPIGERDVADHRSAVFGVEMQLFADRIEQDFDIFDDRVALALLVKGVFFGTFDGVFEHVVQTTKAGGFALVKESFAAAGDEHSPHVGLSLGEIKKLPAIFAVAHFDDPLARAVADV